MRILRDVFNNSCYLIQWVFSSFTSRFFPRAWVELKYIFAIDSVDHNCVRFIESSSCIAFYGWKRKHIKESGISMANMLLD